MKTDRDAARERVAHELNRRLLRTNARVAAGGRKGPYTLVVDRLNRKELDAVIRSLLDCLGQRMAD